MATDGMPHQAKGWGVSWNFMPTPQSPTRGQMLQPEADRSSRRQAPNECMHTTGLHAPVMGLGSNGQAPTVHASLETLVLEASHHLGAHVRTYMSTTPGGSGKQSHPLSQRVAMIWPRALVHFASSDELGTGRLTMAEFSHGLAMLGLVAKREEVQKLFHSFTADRNGTVSYRAIGSMLQKDAALLEKEALKRALAGSLSRMNDRFRQFDADGSGTVDKLEFRKVVASIVHASDEACDAIFDEFDEDCSGGIKYIEYIRASLRGALKTSFTRVIDLFRKWDTDESGTIERPELHACLRAVGFDAPADVVDELFAEMDVDGSGSVEYKELHRVLRQGQNSKLPSNLRPGAVDFAMYAENPQALRRSGSFDSAFSARQRGGFGFRLRRDVSPPTRSLQPGAFDFAIGTYGLNQHALRRSGSFERTHVHTIEKQTSPNQARNQAPSQAPSGPLKAVTIEGLRAALTANRTRVIDAFRMLDKDSDGTITKAEFRGALPLLGFDASRTDLADELFKTLDSDGGGTISFDELNQKLRQGAAVELAAELKAGAAGAIELKAKNKVAPGSLRRGQTRGEPSADVEWRGRLCRVCPATRYSAHSRPALHSARVCSESCIRPRRGRRACPTRKRAGLCGRGHCDGYVSMGCAYASHVGGARPLSTQPSSLVKAGPWPHCCARGRVDQPWAAQCRSRRRTHCADAHRLSSTAALLAHLGSPNCRVSISQV